MGPTLERLARVLTIAAAALAGAAAPASGGRTPSEVDLQLVLAVDVSGSMDADEHRVQRSGFVEAIRHPEIWHAIQSGANQRIALTYVEWAGPVSQVTIIPWRTIDSASAAQRFAEDLAAEPISLIRGTSISGALDYVSSLFEGNGYVSPRRVADISGDGPNNMGRPVLDAREALLAEGVVVNGLPIMIRPSWFGGDSLDAYYADCVIGGLGAFVYPVRRIEDLAVAIRRKLVLEIAAAPHAPAAVVIPAQATKGVDCLLGERYRWIWSEP